MTHIRAHIYIEKCTQARTQTHMHMRIHLCVQQNEVSEATTYTETNTVTEKRSQMKDFRTLSIKLIRPLINM